MAKKKHDLTGQRFGRLTVIHPSEKKKWGAYLWDCVCDCGKEYAAHTRSLLTGRTRSCGCLHKDTLTRRNSLKFNDLTGKRFGRLLVIKRAEERVNGKISWVCECDCGETKILIGQNLTKGSVNSCGCLREEMSLLSIEDTKNAREMIDGTAIDQIQDRKLNKNSQTGVKGVCFTTKAGIYRAYIMFKRKQYHLGFYDTLEKAAQARREAEERIYGEFLEWYALTKKPNDSDTSG